MHRLRNRLIAAFFIATIVPMAATIWIATSLLDRSLAFATTGELDRLSRSLEETVREFYRRDRRALLEAVESGAAGPTRYDAPPNGEWPAHVRDFWTGSEAERFQLVGEGGDHLDYLRRDESGVSVYTRSLGNIRMEEIFADFRRARSLIGTAESRDLRRGFTLTLILLAAGVWCLALASLVFLAHRISRPIRDLTDGLARLASGNFSERLRPVRDDEVGRAVEAFNNTARQLEGHQQRLVHFTQIASWQSLARKTAHEVKNSLTPIRLTVEEMLARHDPSDLEFMEQAAQIVVNEIETLERRVRAFSEYSSEPEVDAQVLDLNALAEERVAFLRTAHPMTRYDFQLDPGAPRVLADVDRVNGILTNLLENAAEATRPNGTVLLATWFEDGMAVVEIHDSGPGLSDEARRTLFEPTITFKKHGMGLGLSIARKHALLSGGDIMPVTSILGGAAFRVALPSAPGHQGDQIDCIHDAPPHTDRR